MLSQNTIEKIAVRQGLITFILLGLYFLLMKSLGLVHLVEFRLLNAGIMFYGCFNAVKMTKLKLKDFNFIKGYGVGLLTSLVAASLFSLFGFFYLEFINPNFITEIREQEILGVHQNKFIAVAQIFIEGSASGILFTHASVMWFKKNQYTASDKAKVQI